MQQEGRDTHTVHHHGHSCESDDEEKEEMLLLRQVLSLLRCVRMLCCRRCYHDDDLQMCIECYLLYEGLALIEATGRNKKGQLIA